MAYLGEQVREQRMQVGLDQQSLVRASIIVGAVKNLESDNGSTLSSLIKILRCPAA